MFTFPAVVGVCSRRRRRLRLGNSPSCPDSASPPTYYIGIRLYMHIYALLIFTFFAKSLTGGASIKPTIANYNKNEMKLAVAINSNIQDINFMEFVYQTMVGRSMHSS